MSDPFSVFVTGLESATWTFGVRAEDRAGNVSELSGPATGHGATVDRVSGSDRVRTAVAVSAATFADAHTVVFASAAAYPDGLSAASLAGALHAPVILVGAGVLPKVITDELTRLGAVDGYVIGGTTAVSSATFSSIHGRLTGTLTRLSGPDRYATAAAVATAVAGIEGPRGRVYVVSGENFPDALSCGSAAYAEAAPILFARKLSLPGVTARAVQSVGATGCIIVGSGKALFGGLEAQLPRAFRIGGADRYATSAAFADWAIGRGILTAARPVVVTGATFPDGLACSPLAGERNGPVLLIHTVGLDPLPWLNPHRVQIQHMTVIGGTAVIPATDKRILWWRLTSPRTPSPF